MNNASVESARALLAKQRSHLLVVLSNPRDRYESAFREWFTNAYRKGLMESTGILGVQQYEQHEVDVTVGRWPRVPFRYLTLLDIAVDGAESAKPLIEYVSAVHSEEHSASPPATWLYYPASEKVGRRARTRSSLLTIAFANGLPGQEDRFREWYATRHVRHALYIDALVSGQCFERTQFQQAGAHEAVFATIAIYEQEGTPESMLDNMASIKPGVLNFPMLDLDRSRFSESVYRPVLSN